MMMFSTIIVCIILLIYLRTSVGFSTIPPLARTKDKGVANDIPPTSRIKDVDNEINDGSTSTTSPPTRIKDTRVSANGRATAAIIPPPLQHSLSHNVTLTNYMQLPVEQYVLIPMPLGSSLTTRDKSKNSDTGTDLLSANTEFELVVPTITFFKMSLQPVVYASVYPQENRVVISSSKCILRGSSFIEKTQLNDRFDFSVNTTLTWNDTMSDIYLSQNNNQNGDVNEDENHMNMRCSITAETCIKVDVDVPRPFSSIPKRIIERTGNAAMNLSLRYIQANFVENLAEDYNKWATDNEYRNYRASLSGKEVGEVMQDEEDEVVFYNKNEEVEDILPIEVSSYKSSKWKRLLSKFRRRNQMKVK